MAIDESEAGGEAVTEDAPETAAPSEDRGQAFLKLLGRAALVAGQAVGRGAVVAGKTVAAGYRAIDPDVRRQVAQLPLVGLTMLAPSRPAIERLDDDGAPPVLCVHGLQGAAGNFAPLRAFLSAAGRRRSYSAWFEPEQDIFAMAQRLTGIVDEIFAVNALPEGARIDIVAHSMGGLITRLALLEPAFAKRVRSLITLGTPHHGTHLARLASTSLIHALRPGSLAVERLAGQLPWLGPPSLPALTSIWSSSDVMLLPSTCAVVEGANNVALPGLTHTGFLLHPAAFFAVLRALERDNAATGD